MESFVTIDVEENEAKIEYLDVEFSGDCGAARDGEGKEREPISLGKKLIRTRCF